MDETTGILSRSERAFLTTARQATLATIGPTGRPRLVPICFCLREDAEPVGPPLLYSPIDDKPKRGRDPRSLGRVRDVLARPGVTVLVDRWDEDWSRLAWLRCDGTADLVDPGSEEHAAAVSGLREKYPQYADHHLEGRPLIRVVVERVTSWGGLDVC
jgi:PPOX class probable F420-dependent enzyme